MICVGSACRGQRSWTRTLRDGDSAVIIYHEFDSLSNRSCHDTRISQYDTLSCQTKHDKFTITSDKKVGEYTAKM